MIRSMLGGVAALALMTGVALAQNSYSQTTTTVTQNPPTPMLVQPAPRPLVVNGPSYDRTTTTHQIDANGVETERTDSYQKQQSYSDRDGSLSARTTTQTQSRVSTQIPPPPLPTVLVPDEDEQTAAVPPSTVSTTTYAPDGRPLATTIVMPSPDDDQ